jgi:metallophosphoesterase superfamily enzyme
MPAMDFEWAGQRLAPRADRSLYWIDQRTLLIADPHFGKDAAFRSAGIPVPHSCTNTTAARLSRALHQTGARRLVILGDFLHARLSRTEALWRTLRDWRAEHRDVDMATRPKI